MVSLSTDHAGRIAFVDLLFCWPPNGGADVDLYHVAAELVQAGYEVRVFVPRYKGIAGRGIVRKEDALPFSITLLDVPEDKDTVVARICEALGEWGPNLVFLMHGYALKAHLAVALRAYPLVGRYYAHELLCLRDAYRFKHGEPCPYNYMDHPDHCRRCALEHLGPEIKSGRHGAWTQEYVLAGAFNPDYHQTVLNALAAMDRIVVSNVQLQEALGRFQDKGVVIPGGIAEVSAGNVPLHFLNLPEGKKIILMTGRVEDPAKGLDVLMRAGRLLARDRNDFHVVATHFDPFWRGPWHSGTGWLTFEETQALYGRASVVVVPSLWQEPFGLVAVEAMAAGVPVCASDTGGLRDIVRHDDTGLLYPAGDAAALAGSLGRLLDSPELCAALGQAGAARVRQEYLWKIIIDKHYKPLIESLLS